MKDRFVAAYHAFRMDTRPDVAAVEEAMEAWTQREEAKQQEREAAAQRRKTAVDRLEGYDRALILSVASGTANWEQLLGQVMPVIERLNDEDQLVVMRHIITGNPSAAGVLVVRNWVSRNTRAIFANLPE